MRQDVGSSHHSDHHNHTNKMQFQVTQIEFDFTDDGEWTQHHFDNVVADTLGTIWEADNEDDLIEEITCATGWAVKSLDYNHHLR